MGITAVLVASLAASALGGPGGPQHLFAQLLDAPGVRCAVELTPDGRGGNTLVASRAVAAGDELARVPSELLLTAHRSGVVGGLIGQTDATWDAAGDLREEVGPEAFARGATWDVRLAVALFEATAGAGGPFWDAYRSLLPTAAQIVHPLALPAAALEAVQDDALVARVRARAALLQSLYPALHTRDVHPATSSYAARGAPIGRVPFPLPYFYALVVSRCYSMADGETFAFVPFLDMCDHEARPAAEFEGSDGGFVLRALRAVPAGGAVTICYGEDYGSSRLFEQYGFAPSCGAAADAAALRELVRRDEAAGVAALDAGAVEALRSSMRESRLWTAERADALLGALTEDGKDAAAVAPGQLLEAVRRRIDALPTSLAEDLTQLDEQAASSQMVAVLGYRIVRKRQLAFAEEVLAGFPGEAAHGGS